VTQKVGIERAAVGGLQEAWKMGLSLYEIVQRRYEPDSSNGRSQEPLITESRASAALLTLVNKQQPSLFIARNLSLQQETPDRAPVTKSPNGSK
jgi:hypothetical protein